MASDKDKRITAASPDVDDAVGTPTVIDEDELVAARLDERWRDFCLNAEEYVAMTTRAHPRVEQHV